MTNDYFTDFATNIFALIGCYVCLCWCGRKWKRLNRPDSYTGVYSKDALLVIRDMLRDVPHMQSYRNTAEMSEVRLLLGELGTTHGNEAVVKLED